VPCTENIRGDWTRKHKLRRWTTKTPFHISATHFPIHSIAQSPKNPPKTLSFSPTSLKLLASFHWPWPVTLTDRGCDVLHRRQALQFYSASWLFFTTSKASPLGSRPFPLHSDHHRLTLWPVDHCESVLHPANSHENLHSHFYSSSQLPHLHLLASPESQGRIG